MGNSIVNARIETFKLSLLDLERRNYIISDFVGGKYTIDTQTDIGIIDFFPKANKILIRKDNEWKDNGIKWIVLNLLN